jgi:enamine deaminase RidA (YjgF/YER057c/UK114 family)
MQEQARASVNTGTVWEGFAGYSRAVRVGEHIYVSGTTAIDAEGNLVGPNDPAAQARFILDKIERAMQQLGGELRHVVRTRTYVSSIAHWEQVARVHGERLGDIRPASTLVEARLVSPELLVEIEVEAIVSD